MEPPFLIGESPATELALLVAPHAGSFRPLPDLSRLLAGGDVLGHVVGADGRGEVLSPADAVLDGVLAGRGEPVRTGQVLAWGRRCGFDALVPR